MTTTPKLEKLANQWIEAKQEEQKAETKRLGIEAQIIAAAGKAIPTKGTCHVGPLKIVTGFTDKWDQDALDLVDAKWLKKWPIFPFKSEWKPANGEINYLKENLPEAYAALKPALIETKAKKPAFSMEKNADE